MLILLLLPLFLAAVLFDEKVPHKTYHHFGGGGGVPEKFETVLMYECVRVGLQKICPFCSACAWIHPAGKDSITILQQTPNKATKGPNFWFNIWAAEE